MKPECKFNELPDGNFKCEVCGFEDYEVTHRVCGQKFHSPVRGVGDVVANVTKAVGVKPCGGCKGRQKKMNETQAELRAAYEEKKAARRAAREERRKKKGRA